MQYGGSDGDGAADFTLTPNGFAVYSATRSFDLVPNEDYYLVMTDISGISGCNEQPLDVKLIDGDPEESDVLLKAVPVDEIAQINPEWNLVEFIDRDIVTSPRAASVEPR